MTSPPLRPSCEIINLNVGGTRFSTSRQTLTQVRRIGHLNHEPSPNFVNMKVQDTFFTGLLSGRIQTYKDDQGAIFIDRDPHLFRHILNYLRNRSLSFEEINLKDLKHEAEYYGIGPLVKKLSLCEDLDKSGCGDVLFYSYLAPPSVPQHEQTKPRVGGAAAAPAGGHSRAASVDLRRSHSRTSSADLRAPQRPDRPPPPVPGHATSHSRNSSADLNKSFRNEVGLLFGASGGGQPPLQPWLDPLRVLLVTAHHRCAVKLC